MKDQYFGDVNDYRKYGLLRVLIDAGLSMLISWMRTPNDGSTDGRYLAYLKQPDGYRAFDPPLFDRLREAVAEHGRRELSVIEEAGLLPGAAFQSEILEPGESARTDYFAETSRLADGRDLVFFDPDNGLEIKSVSHRSPKAPKFLFRSELASVASPAQGSDRTVLIYQHFPRVDRAGYALHRSGEVLHDLQRPLAYAIRTSHVLFLLAPADAHHERCARAMHVLAERWAGQFIIDRIEADEAACATKRAEPTRASGR